MRLVITWASSTAFTDSGKCAWKYAVGEISIGIKSPYQYGQRSATLSYEMRMSNIGQHFISGQPILKERYQ